MTKLNYQTIVLLSSLVIILTFSSCQKQITPNQIHTVQGAIHANKLGKVLSHEHIMSNFGKEIDETSNYDTLKLFAQVIPYLQNLKSLGVNTIFDCTTAYFGRRVDLLQKIADSTGIQIVTNTGFYGAAGDKYIPQFAYSSSVKDIAKVWINEFENGIDGTQIRPGFIKMAFDDGQSPSEIDKKLFEAGVLTHLSTGLTMAVHTGANIEAVQFQIALLEQYKIHPSAWIWTHANKLSNDELLITMASKGAWISLDGVNKSNIDEYIERIRLFAQRKLLHKILLSHDGNGFPRGGEIRQFDAIFNLLIPKMLKSGFTQKDINQIFVGNPREAFSIGIKRFDYK